MQERRYLELDGLRGIACLAVVLDHCVTSALPPDFVPGLHRLSEWLIGGVDLFFVLSGFLIGGILLDHRTAANYFRVFWTRRVSRIMPVYYLLMLTFFAVLLVKPWLGAPWLDVFLFKDTMPLWTYPLFVQNFAQAFQGGDGGARWVASTWSLAIEEQFYLLLPPLVYVLSRRKVTVLAVVCIVAALGVRAFAFQRTGSVFAGYFLLPGRMDALMFGVLAALATRHSPTMRWLAHRRWPLDGLALAAAAILSTNILNYLAGPGTSLLSFGIRSLDFTLKAAVFAYMILRIFLVPAQARYRRALASPVLVAAGTISYALYMYHPAINGLLHGMFFGTEPRITNLPQLAVALLVIGSSVALAWVSTTYFEMPIRRLAHRMKYREVADTSPAPTASVSSLAR